MMWSSLSCSDFHRVTLATYHLSASERGSCLVSVIHRIGKAIRAIRGLIGIKLSIIRTLWYSLLRPYAAPRFGGGWQCNNRNLEQRSD